MNLLQLIFHQGKSPLLIPVIIGLILMGCKSSSDEFTPPKTYPFIINKAPLESGCRSVPPYYKGNTSTYVQPDFDNLNLLEPGKKVWVALPDDTMLVRMERVVQQLLYKKIEFTVMGSDEGTFSLIYRGGDSYSAEGSLIGDIYLNDRLFEFRKCSQSNYRIGEVDKKKLTTYDTQPHIKSGTLKRAPINCHHENGAARIDLMIVYTDSARIEAGSQTQLEADILLSVEKANEAFIKNKVFARLEIAYLGEYENYNKSLELSTNSMADKLTPIGNDEALRKKSREFGADLYLIYVKNGNDEYNGFSRPESRFAVLRSTAASQRYLLAHEIGHLCNADHDEECFTMQGGVGKMGIMCNKDGYEREVQYYLEGANCDPVVLKKLQRDVFTVAGYACRPLPSKAVILDFFIDDGSTPSTKIDTQSIMNSPNIYLLTQRDPTRSRLYQTENPRSGTDNYLYIMVRNGSGQIVKGDLTAYRYKGMLNPTFKDIEEVGERNDILIPPYGSEVVEIAVPKNLQDLENSGFVAYFTQEGENPSAQATTYLSKVVAEDNQMAARASFEVTLAGNIPQNQIDGGNTNGDPAIHSIIPNQSIASLSLPFRPTHDNQIRFRYLPSEETGNTFLEDGGTFQSAYKGMKPNSIDYSKELPNGDGMDSTGTPLPITKTESSGTFVNSFFVPDEIVTDPKGEAKCFFNIVAPETPKQANYPIQVHLLENGKVIGAYNYLIRTSK